MRPCDFYGTYFSRMEDGVGEARLRVSRRGRSGTVPPTVPMDVILSTNI